MLATPVDLASLIIGGALRGLPIPSTVPEYPAARAYGRDDRPLVTFQEPKSRSRETTFEEDTRDWDAIARVLVKLCTQVVEDLKKRSYLGKTIGVKVRYDNFRIVTRDNGVEVPVNDPLAIRKAAFAALARVAPEQRFARPIRLIGVRVGTLNPQGAARAAPDAALGESLSLF